MFQTLDIGLVLAVFAAAAAVVAAAGVRIATLADRIADRTGLGEAVAGAVLLGVATSLAGTVVSVASAMDGRASLAFANGVGGIAAQTAFLAVADLWHRRANIEHASAEPANLFQASLLIVLLSLPLAAATGPDFTIGPVHPASIVLVLIYLAGVRAAGIVRDRPMWRPVHTPETRRDTPDDPPPGRSAPADYAEFALLAAILGAAGWVLSGTGARISDAFGISETVVGALMTAVATSLPELVTTLAAVRRGAIQLAVGGIIGGNTFDVLFLSLSDAFYTEGSLYHAVGTADLFWAAAGLLMTGIVLLGLIVREKAGAFRIGFESVAVLAVYALAVLVAALGR